MKIEPWQLAQRQSMSLTNKELMSLKRIDNFVTKLEGKVYVAFSGGRDSTVLLHLVRRVYPNVIPVFNNTGLEYPEVMDFVKQFDNVIQLRPKKSFLQVVEEYGYPVISKENAQKIREIRTTNSQKLYNKRMFGDEKGHGKLSEKWKFMVDAPFGISEMCCKILKERPAISYENKSGNSAIVGTMAVDSSLRKTSYLRHGCTQIGGNRNMLTPLSFWTDQDIKDYITKYNVEISKIYSLGYEHTGCMFCAFGCQHDKPGENKFSLMKKTHPVQFKYCMERLGLEKIFKFMGVKV